MKDDKQRYMFCKRILYIGVSVMLAAAIAGFFIPSFGSVFLTVGIVAAVGMFLIIRILFRLSEKIMSCHDIIVAKSEGYVEIRYDKKSETAFVYGHFSEITGLDAASRVLDDVDYKNLMCELIACPSDAGADIYMAARPESWIRIRTFENEDFEFTLIFDVSEYVSCHNIIKSLKYYDSETGVLCRDAFISKIRSASEKNKGVVALVTLQISGVDKVTSFKGTSAADKVVSKAAAFIKRYENPHNIFAGRTATNEFSILLTDTYEEQCRKYADKLYSGLSELLGAMDTSEYVRVYCGYAMFTGTENEAGAMMSSVDYAAFEAKTSSAAAPVEFDRANYVLRAYDFKKIQVFNTIIGEKKINYHFQPVVDAHTGSIFGYEMLMRPQEIDGIKLTPPEVLKIAETQGVINDIEVLTLSNAARFIKENISFFEGKRLFINSIPNCIISDEIYENLFGRHKNIFDKIILEITEGSQINSECIDLLRERYVSKGVLAALDDYGSGYANESTLLSIQPQFIKIDRSIVSGIDTDVQKQQLVANMIKFAKNHGIKTLSEGIETKGELETVITLGIDLIQGFYTGKPNAVVLPQIAENIKNEILDINLRNIGYTQKTYTLNSSESVDVAELVIQGYTDIIVETEEANFVGSHSRSVNMRISCADGYCGRINIKNVSIFGLDAPVLTLGKNCDVTLDVEGKNSFLYEGIRVPESSRFILMGDGQLNIDVSSDNGVIIGGNYQQDFGEIILKLDGSLNISSTTENIVAIGGGTGKGNSSIEIDGGLVTAELKAVSIFGIGAVSGNVGIRLAGGSIDIDGAGQNVVAIGSKNGCVDIECSSNVTASCSGDNCCAIGTLENGSGRVVLNDGKYELAVRSKNSVAVGAVGGKVDVAVNSGNYDISCEGNCAVGIGDYFGSGDNTVCGGITKIHTSASTEVPIGSRNGKTVIRGGNITTDSKEKIKAVSPYGDMLEERQVEADGKFLGNITFGGSEYEYSAETVQGENKVSIYLPIGFEI